MPEKTMRAEPKQSREKRFPLSAGTALFLAFNFMLILGFCKFSFYVLKNHRDAVDRVALVGTYVDVQPAGALKERSPYIKTASGGSVAPAPFFTDFSGKRDESESPRPDLRNVVPVAAVVRPPVLRAPKTKVDSLPVSERTPRFSERSSIGNDDGVSLDNLMASGLDLLDKSGESVAASEILLDDPAPAIAVRENGGEANKTTTVAAAESIASEIQIADAAPAVEKAPPIAVKKETKKKVSAPKEGTRWIDIAALRRELADRNNDDSVKQKNEIARQNAAMLDMNDAHQTADADARSASDAVVPAPAGSVEKTATPKSKTATVPPSKPVPAENKPSAAVAPPVANAAEKKAPPPAKSTHLAGNAQSLWKVAKVRGKSNTPETKAAEPARQPSVPEKDSAGDGALTPMDNPASDNGGASVIYRNGKAKPVETAAQKKSLNWLDRQEAAVWTSMSQSDAPSVWSASAESVPADRARAFRIADEQPAPVATQTLPESDAGNKNDVVNSAPVRTVGEAEKPESKTNPLLLPLGGSKPQTTETPALTATTTATPVTAPAATIPTNPAGLSAALSNSPATNPASPNAAATDDGLVNKIFSFFGKPEVDALPSIGSGAPVEKSEEKKPVDNVKKPKAATVQTAGQKPAAAVKRENENRFSVPSELRLTFRPDSSEMSAQTVKWIKAFGLRVKNDIQNAVEIRMSNTNPTLQEKRFAIIYSTLTGVGVEDVQIIPVMTDRTPHTIVLRMIVLPEEGYTEYTSDNGGIKERLYYKQW